MKYIRKLTAVHSYDIPGLESWLEEQAAKDYISSNMALRSAPLPAIPHTRSATVWTTAIPTGILTPSPVCSLSTARWGGTMCAAVGLCFFSVPETPTLRNLTPPPRPTPNF